MLLQLAQAIFFVTPFVLAGVVHIAVIKFNLLQSLASLPLDGGAKLLGQPIFGKNKTVRGALTMILSVTFWFFMESIAARHFLFVSQLSVVNYERIHPLSWGLLLGVGCVIGELPNSFLKRRLNIAPGEEVARGFFKPFFWIFDQIDSLIGVLIFAGILWKPSWSMLISLFALAIVIHPLGAAAMVRLGLKRSIGSVRW
jgi:CDP-diglyceride synthetase